MEKKYVQNFSKIIVAICLLLASFTNNSFGQAFSTKGKDFWMGFMANYNDQATLKIFITATLATSGTVSIPGLSWNQNFTVAANSTTPINIPIGAMATGSGTVQNKGIRIVSNDTISVYALNYQEYTSDACVIYPVNSLDRKYRVQTIKGWPNDWGVQYMVVATANNSVVQITPPGGSAYTVNMNAGQVYQVQSSNDLSGTYIQEMSACSKIAVYVGNVCTNIGGCVACDHLCEQILPLSRWGKNFITAPFMNKGKDYFRIVANDNATSVSINNGVPFNLNAGQVHQFDANQPRFITASKPVQIIQYAQGGSCDGVGDPFSVMVPPIEQSINNITFNAFTSSIITSYYVNIVTKTNSTNILTLDGTPRPFTTVPGNPLYAYARVPITQGNHTILSDSGFIAMVYGYGSYESYGYSTGFSLKNLNYDFYISNADTICSAPGIIPQPVDTVCPNELLCFKVPMLYPDVTTYTWNFGDGNTATGAAVLHQYATYGTYIVTLTLTTQDGCSTTIIQKTIHIVQLDLNVTPSGPTTFCQGGSVTLNAGSPFASYHWSNGSTNQSINVGASGTYTVTVTDSRGCEGAASVPVTVNPNPAPTITPSGPTTFCNGLSVNLNAGGPYIQYNWSNGATSQSINVTTSGTYSVTVSDNFACSGSTSIPVTVNPLPVVQFSQVPQFCVDAAPYTLIQGAPSGGVYSGTGVSSGIFNPAVAGVGTHTITYTFTNGNNCTDSASTNIIVNALPIVTMAAMPDVCVDISPFVLTSGSPAGGTYSGTGITNNTFDPAVAGVGTHTITYTYTDGNTCTNFTTGDITVNPLPTISLTTDQTICNGDTATLVVSGLPGSTFLWSTSETTDTINVNPSNTTTYTVTVTDANNCGTISGTVTVTVHPLATAYAGEDIAICEGDSTVLTATGLINSTFLWSTGDTVETIVVSPAITTTYIVSVTDQYNCSTATDDVIVTFFPASVADFGYTPDSNIFTNELISFLNNSVNAATYFWTFGDGMSSSQITPYHMYSLPGEYEISLITISSDGCMDTAYTLLFVVEGLEIPNVFTPNGDGYNDVFEVKTSGIIEYNLQIFNRWGVLIFESYSSAIHWDGRTIAGVETPSGTYFYILTAKSGTKDYSRTGFISLLR
ncbi:MAG: PKD domain-containing protein [Bacteroidales bacterium]|nr:PKD domain-containing protein [Bacteroidales bacterium]